MTYSKEKIEANKQWKLENKKKQQIYNYRSSAKRFIKEYASDNDLRELEELIRAAKEKS